MLVLDEIYRYRGIVAESIEEKGITDPLQAFEHAWEQVAAGKVKAAELITMTSRYPSPKLNLVSSPLFLYGGTVSIDSPQAAQLDEVLQAFIEDISPNTGEHDRLLKRLTEEEPPDYVRHETYFDLRAWVTPTHNPEILLGVQSATDDRGELSRRFFIAKKPFDIKRFLSELWGNAVQTPDTRS